MKITEPMLPLNNMNQPNSPKSAQHFAQLIETPTQNSSGDEYYWQHQEHLQQSCLSFTQQLGEKQSHEELSIQPEKAIPGEEHEVFPDENLINHTHQWLQTPQQRTAAPVTSVLNKAIMIPRDYLNYAGLKDPEKIDNKNTKPTAPKSEQVLTPLLPKVPLKKHHVFIQDDAAELTFQTAELNQKEQRELTQMIKQNLKQKGLTLKQLIINGVKND